MDTITGNLFKIVYAFTVFAKELQKMSNRNNYNTFCYSL